MVVSGLLVGATIVLYDGSPAHPGPARLWELAAEQRVSVLGVSPGYLQGSTKAGLEPGRGLDLSAPRILGSTGAPLPASSYHWVHDHVGPRVQVASTSGDTDIVIEVPALPHTRTGKKLEIPVKRLLQGVPIEQVVNSEAVDDYAALIRFTHFARAGS